MKSIRNERQKVDSVNNEVLAMNNELVEIFTEFTYYMVNLINS